MGCIDPPYDAGNDLIYLESFADLLETYLKLVGSPLQRSPWPRLAPFSPPKTLDRLPDLA